MKRWFQPFGLHTRSFMQVSSAISFRLPPASISAAASFRLAPALRLSLGFHFHGLSPLPLLFLTPAVFALFRPLQFWVLTTQPLFLPFPLFLSPPHSGFLSAPFPLSLPRSSPFSPAWFPVLLIPVPVLSFAVCFLSPFPDSLPRPFLRCLPSAFASCIFRSASAFFRPLDLCFRLLGPLFLPFRSSRFCLTVASSVPVLRFRFLRFPVLPCLISHAFFPGFRTRLSVGFLSS